MKLSALKKILPTLSEVIFQLPNGSVVPQYFHITEVGHITKQFIDCGGTLREEHLINLQLWEANDFDHRLTPEKLLNIISIGEQSLNLKDNEVEVEYQQDTIGKFGLHFNNGRFLLTSKHTNCLAQDQCGIPSEKLKTKLSDLSLAESCIPGGGCC